MNQLRTELIKHDEWNYRTFAAIIAAFGYPQSYLDVGCGTGIMVKLARQMGIVAAGIDLIDHPEGFLIKHDIREPFNLDHQFQFATCIEVMEHIEQPFDGVAVESIANHLLPGGRLIFTAAGPGQGGIDHVNCQSGVYWRSKFYEHGVSYRDDLTDLAQRALTLIPSPMRPYLIGNVQVFDK